MLQKSWDQLQDLTLARQVQHHQLSSGNAGSSYLLIFPRADQEPLKCSFKCRILSQLLFR
jgi:hypothetical protein